MSEPRDDPTHDDRPNVVLMTAHDMGRELGCYGRQAHTPTLDALAAAGSMFERHFCTSPHCAPSRASVLTGLQPHNHGMMGHPFHSGHSLDEVFANPSKGWEIDEGIPTLPMYLRRRGYETHLAGFVHSSKETLGHDRYHRHPDPNIEGGVGASDVADVTETIIHDEVSPGKPFFIEAATRQSHTSGGGLESRYSDDPIPGYGGPGSEEIDLSRYFDDGVDGVDGWDEDTIRDRFAVFYELMYELDRAVGRILDALDETGQRENTVFVFTADHGLGMHRFVPKCKKTCYDGGIESALLMHYPGRIEGGERYDTLVSHVDVLPTLLDLVDGRPPAGIDGQSVRPLVDSADSRSYDERDEVFVEKTWFGEYDPVRGIRTDDYKLLRNFWPRAYEDSAREWATEVELYDLREDPREEKNLAEHPAYVDVREELYDRLRRRLESDDDPIIDGPVPPKPGAFDTTI